MRSACASARCTASASTESEYGMARKSSYHTGGLSFYEPGYGGRGNRWNEFLQWVVYTVIAIALGVFFTQMFGFRVRMSDASMQPGIIEGEHVLINTMAYRLSSPESGDVIAFYPSGNTEQPPLIKRIAAIPGESVQIENGVVLIDGVPAPGSDALALIRDPGMAEAQIILKDGEYFVLGDERNVQQTDSRSPGLGVIHTSDIIGEVWVALPSGDAGLHFVE